MQYILRLRTYENPARVHSEHTSREHAGGWRDAIIRVTSQEEAIALASRCALGRDEVLEFRQVYELSDFVGSEEETCQGTRDASVLAVQFTSSSRSLELAR